MDLISSKQSFILREGPLITETTALLLTPAAQRARCHPLLCLATSSWLLLQCSDSANAGASLDVAPRPLPAIRELNLFSSCRPAGGSRAFHLVWKAMSFQPLQESFPSWQAKTACPLFGSARIWGSWSCRVLEKTWLSLSGDLCCCTNCWPSATAFLHPCPPLSEKKTTSCCPSLSRCHRSPGPE